MSGLTSRLKWSTTGGKERERRRGDTEVKSKKITSHPIVQSRIMEHKRPFHFRCNFGGAAEGL